MELNWILFGWLTGIAIFLGVVDLVKYLRLEQDEFIGPWRTIDLLKTLRAIKVTGAIALGLVVVAIILLFIP